MVALDGGPASGSVGISAAGRAGRRELEPSDVHSKMHVHKLNLQKGRLFLVCVWMFVCTEKVLQSKTEQA